MIYMGIGIDWKRSLIMTAILIGVLYVLGEFITDRDTYCMVAIVIFVVVLLVGNLVFRR
jgi:hypothetical protein